MLRSLKSLQWDAFGYRNEVEQSERPDGLYVTEFNTVSEVHDLSGKRYRPPTELHIYPVVEARTTTVVVDDVVMQLSGERQMAGTPQQKQLVRERIALSSERVLLSAGDGSILSIGKLLSQFAQLPRLLQLT